MSRSSIILNDGEGAAIRALFVSEAAHLETGSAVLSISQRFVDELCGRTHFARSIDLGKLPQMIVKSSADRQAFIIALRSHLPKLVVVQP